MDNQEQEKLYNKITEYYNFSERLIELVQNSLHELSEEQFLLIEETVNKLQDQVDKLSNNYIQFVKQGKSSKLIDNFRTNFHDISSQIEECRNRILMLYQGR